MTSPSSPVTDEEILKEFVSIAIDVKITYAMFVWEQVGSNLGVSSERVLKVLKDFLANFPELLEEMEYE